MGMAAIFVMRLWPCEGISIPPTFEGSIWKASIGTVASLHMKFGFNRPSDVWGDVWKCAKN